MTTGLAVSGTFKVIVLSERDYNIKVMTGEISTETVAPGPASAAAAGPPGAAGPGGAPGGGGPGGKGGPGGGGGGPGGGKGGPGGSGGPGGDPGGGPGGEDQGGLGGSASADCDLASTAPTISFFKEVTYEGVLGLFLANYGTVDNYVRSYGGEAKIDEPDQELPKSNQITIRFSREIKYPRELVSKFDPGFREEVPVLQLSDDDKELV